MDLGFAQHHQNSKLWPWVCRFIPEDCDVFLAVAKSVIELETYRSEVWGIRAAVPDRRVGNDVAGLQFRGQAGRRHRQGLPRGVMFIASARFAILSRNCGNIRHRAPIAAAEYGALASE